MAKIVCLYHADCFDGAWAAWVVRRKYPSAKLIATNYHRPLPDIEPGSVVYILDFSYDWRTLARLAHTASQVVMLDHHARMESIVDDVIRWKEHMAELVSVNGPAIAERVGLYYKPDESGAMMAWNFFYPGVEPPRWIKYASDYDLWKFQYKETRPFMAALGTYPIDPDQYMQLTTSYGHRLPSFMLELAPHAERVQRLAEDWAIRHTLRKIDIGYDHPAGYTFTYTVPLINCAHGVTSGALERLCEPGSFAMSYYDMEDYRKFSLRSKDFDVRPIARHYGGEGHAGAAGFTVPRNHPLAKI